MAMLKQPFQTLISWNISEMGDHTLPNAFIKKKKSNFPTAVEGDTKAPFSLASTSW